jgi:hypothetical protein
MDKHACCRMSFILPIVGEGTVATIVWFVRPDDIVLVAIGAWFGLVIGMALAKGKFILKTVHWGFIVGLFLGISDMAQNTRAIFFKITACMFIALLAGYLLNPLISMVLRTCKRIQFPQFANGESWLDD